MLDALIMNVHYHLDQEPEALELLEIHLMEATSNV